MSVFTTPLAYVVSNVWHPDSRPVYKLTAAFSYDVGAENSDVSIHVPAGFVTDFASVPKWADDWFGLDPAGDNAKAAVLHDWLYANPHSAHQYMNRAYRSGLLKDWVRPINARHFADLIFFEALGLTPATGLKRVRLNIRRFIMYSAVRLFGAASFRRSLLRSRSQT